MQLFSHQSHIDVLPESPLKDHIQARFDQLYETDEDLLPNLILVEAGDNITGPDFAFVGPDGVLSDLFEKHKPDHPEFARPYEWVSFIPGLEIFEILLLLSGEDGFLIFIPEAVVESHPDLKWVLTDDSQGGLSDPQPM